ncbi:MAG: S9 family peptidase [Actinomycetota bacterium]
MPTKRGMLPEDVYELVGVSDPRLSPDGKTCAYVVTTIDRDKNAYLSSIWMVPADGSAPARRFTRGKRRDSSPRWSPDGTRLAFTSSRDEDKAAQLYVIPVAGGEALKLTDLKESADAPEWSPDGTRIAFTSRVRDETYDEEDDRKRKPRHIKRLKYKLDSVGWTFDRPRHVFVVDAEGVGEARQITSGDFEDSSATWSPDGKSIAFVSARHRDWDTDLGANDIFIVGARGGRPRRLTKTEGRYAVPSWSPDGTKIACLYSEGRFKTRHPHVAVIGVTSGRRRMLTKPVDRNCAPFGATREPIWIGDRDLLFAIEDAGNNAIYRVPVTGTARPKLVRTGDWQLRGHDLRNGIGVHVRTAPTSPPALFFRDKQLADHGGAFVRPRTFASPVRFTARSADGSEVEAWIMRPAGFRNHRKYPVLLNIHGGPFTQYGNTFFDEFQVYASAGYVVLYCNPRGSSGYGEAWGAAINGPKLGGSGWGTVDYEDVMAVTDEALRRFDFCDGRRLGVMGGSYGGYLTSWIVSHTHRFKAACSERSVNAWHSMHGSSDFGWPFASQIGTFEFDDPDGEWTRMSPITYTTDIRTPLLILHSENDLRCPIEQAEQLFTTLRLLKRDVEFVRFPAESHELSRGGSPAHRVIRFEVILDWFDRKLKR